MTNTTFRWLLTLVVLGVKLQSPNINVSVIGDYPEAGAHTTLGWGYFEARWLIIVGSIAHEAF